MPSQPAWFQRLDEKWLHPAGRRTAVGLRHLPLAFAGPARLVPTQASCQNGPLA